MLTIELDIEDKREFILKQMAMEKTRERIRRIEMAKLEPPFDPTQWAIPDHLHYPTNQNQKRKRSGLFGFISSFLP